MLIAWKGVCVGGGGKRLYLDLRVGAVAKLHDEKKNNNLFSFAFVSWPASAEEQGGGVPSPSPTSLGSSGRAGCCGRGQPPGEIWGEGLPRALPHTVAPAKVSCCVLGSARCCPPSQPMPGLLHPCCPPQAVASLCVFPELGGHHEVKLR